LRFGDEAGVGHGSEHDLCALLGAFGLRFGARRDGDLTRPASIAASDSETFFADLPKYFCAAASTP
jgi:hypothetical protein